MRIKVKNDDVEMKQSLNALTNGELKSLSQPPIFKPGPDIECKIAKFLSPRDQFALMVVCKKFNESIQLVTQKCTKEDVEDFIKIIESDEKTKVNPSIKAGVSNSKDVTVIFDHLLKEYKYRLKTSITTMKAKIINHDKPKQSRTHFFCDDVAPWDRPADYKEQESTPLQKTQDLVNFTKRILLFAKRASVGDIRWLERQLIAAVEANYSTIVNILLTCGINPNVRNEKYTPLLHTTVAKENINPDIVKALITHKVDITTKDAEGHTVFMIIASHKKLLEMKGKAQWKDKFNFEVILLMLIQYSIAQQINLNDTNPKGQTALMMALIHENQMFINTVVGEAQRTGIDIGVTLVDKLKRNVLTTLLRLNKLETSGSVLHAMGRMYGFQSIVILQEYSRLIRFFLKSGVRINAQDDEGNTALIYAMKNNDYESAYILLQHGADPTIENAENESAQSLLFQKISKDEDSKDKADILKLNELMEKVIQDKQASCKAKAKAKEKKKGEEKDKDLDRDKDKKKDKDKDQDQDQDKEKEKNKDKEKEEEKDEDKEPNEMKSAGTMSHATAIQEMKSPVFGSAMESKRDQGGKDAGKVASPAAQMTQTVNRICSSSSIDIS